MIDEKKKLTEAEFKSLENYRLKNLLRYRKKDLLSSNRIKGALKDSNLVERKPVRYFYLNDKECPKNKVGISVRREHVASGISSYALKNAIESIKNKLGDGAVIKGVYKL